MALSVPIPKSEPSELPPLETGDRLSRSEFERRYHAMPHLKKAELIAGVVFVPSPVRLEQHSGPHADLITWLGVFRASTPGVRVAVNGTIRLDMENEPQPVALMIIEPRYGGQVRISEDDYIEGEPELVAEVASSSVSLDMHAKMRIYRRNGAKEYIVWRVIDQTIDWFVLRRSAYELLPRSPEGIYQSGVFPGLWLDPQALVASDLAAVLRVLQQGLASPEHQEFVQKLQEKTNSAT